MNDREANDDTLLNLQAKSAEDLRQLLDALYEEEQKVSYRRRVLHGKIDILRAELVRRMTAEHEGGENVVSATDIDRLIDILAGDLRGVSRFDVAADDEEED